MVSALKYWRFIRLDAAGRQHVEEVASAQIFIHQQFSDLSTDSTLTDSKIQRRLFQRYSDSSDPIAQSLAECCLRCCISNYVMQACFQLAEEFSEQYYLRAEDLLLFVLTDPHPLQNRFAKRPQQSFAATVLAEFDPDRGSLSSWVTRLVRHHKELNVYLMEQGIYLVSDWAILNDTTPNQVQRIFIEFQTLTAYEAQQACQLLAAYHAVYRRDRIRQRQLGKSRQCLPPSFEQLQQILQRMGAIDSTPEDILTALQDLAQRLRQYRIYARVKMLPSKLLDPVTAESIELEMMLSSEEEEAEALQNQFLAAYREAFEECLNLAIAAEIETCVARLQKRKPYRHQQFLAALELFYCQSLPMGKIALKIGLQQQYQVSRLMRLGAFQAGIRQRLLMQLRDRLKDIAAHYTNPDRLLDFDQQIQAALNEQVDALIHGKAEPEEEKSPSSRLARHLCQSLCEAFDPSPYQSPCPSSY